jgi:hypothetical protein
MKLVEPGLRRGRHDARQIVRVREELEDMSERKGNPVFEFESVSQTALPRRGVISSYKTCLHVEPARTSFSTAISATGAECKKNLSE